MKNAILAGARRWFEIKAAQKDSDETEVLIYDYIGWGGVTALDFVAALKGIEAKKITVSINSPGGDVFEGLAIHNALRAHPAHITARVDGVAASIASIIALGADRVVMAESSFFMIHNPWGFSMGGAADMRAMADTLDKVGATLRDIYVTATGKSAKEIQALMDEETWLNAQESLDAGLADEILTGDKDKKAAKAAAQFNLAAMYARVPAQLTQAPSASAQDVEEGAQRAAIMRRRLALVERGEASH